jgi:protein phosphatase inhibitor 2
VHHNRICSTRIANGSLADIPNLDLDGHYILPRERGTTSPALSVSSTGANTSGPSSRRTSVSSLGRPNSASGRSGSATSSRSTSFNLPNEAKREIQADSRINIPGEEVEFEEEMDEEGKCLVYLILCSSSDL